MYELRDFSSFVNKSMPIKSRLINMFVTFGGGVRATPVKII